MDIPLQQQLSAALGRVVPVGSQHPPLTACQITALTEMWMSAYLVAEDLGHFEAEAVNKIAKYVERAVELNSWLRERQLFAAPSA